MEEHNITKEKVKQALEGYEFPGMTTNDYDLIRLMFRTIKLEVVCSKQEVEIWLLDTTKPFCLGTENSIRQINAFATARGFKVKEMIKL